MITDTDRHLYGLFRKTGRFLHDNSRGNSGQRRVLILLLKSNEMTQRELQTLMDIKSSSLSEMLLKLEHKGFIERTRSQNDQRVILVSLTTKGKEVAIEEKESLDETTELLFSCLDEQEKKDLESLIKKLNNHWVELKNKRVCNTQERGQ